MAKKTLRLGLVGAGAAAQVNHIPAIKKVEGLELVALYDRDPEKSTRVAQKFQIANPLSNFDAMLEPKMETQVAGEEANQNDGVSKVVKVSVEQRQQEPAAGERQMRFDLPGEFRRRRWCFHR